MIKPENKKRYPKNWKKISEDLIIERGEKCEVCGKKRDNENRYKAWLTVHHKNRNPENNTSDNLVVCCPKCHFKFEAQINYIKKHKDNFTLF